MLALLSLAQAVPVLERLNVIFYYFFFIFF